MPDFVPVQIIPGQKNRPELFRVGNDDASAKATYFLDDLVCAVYVFR